MIMKDKKGKLVVKPIPSWFLYINFNAIKGIR